MQKLNKNICILLKVQKINPSSKTIYYIILIIKLIPLFIITHDWDLSLNKGVSKWIRKFTFTEIIFNINSNNVYFFIGIIGFVFFIINSILIVFLRSKVDLEGNISNKYQLQLLIFVYINFYFFYIFNQYFYSFYVEILFSSRNDLLIYIIGIVIFSFPILYSFINTIILSSIIIHDSLFIGNRSPILNPLNNIDYYSLLVSIIQGFVHAEFHIKFKEFVIIKIIIRTIFCLYYIRNFFSFDIYYSSFSFFKILFLFFSICFVSCIIEFIFLYDYDNDLKILQKEPVIIIFKLIIELILGLILTELHFYMDNKNIKKKISNFSHLNPNSFNIIMIKFLNNLYYQDQPYFLKELFFELNDIICKRIHNPICEGKIEKCYYCQIFNSQVFINQINFYIQRILSKDKFNLNCVKKNFPLLAEFLDYEINFYESMTFNDLNILEHFFFIIVYFFLYKKNYYRCVYLIEKIKEKPKIKKNIICILQMEFLKEKILRQYNNELHQINGKIQMITIPDEKKEHSKLIKKYLRNYRSYDRIIYLEHKYKQFLYDYMNLMNNFNDEYINVNLFKHEINKFNQEYKSLNSDTNIILKNYKCNVNYSYIKFTSFYQFFRNEIPKNIEKGLQNFFSEQLSYTIINSNNYYVLILAVELVKNDIIYKIRYISIDLIHKLKYSKLEFKNLTPENIFPKTFYKSYIYNFTKTLEQGIDVIQLNNCCLLDKDKYVILCNLKGSTIFRQNKIEFYLKITEAKEQLIINKNLTNNYKNNDNKSHTINSIKSNHYYGACFLFTNRIGKIQNLSRGFEDYFFINSEVLSKFNINISDLFKFEKFNSQSQGKFTQNLSSIYDNINEIYLREVGQLGEDPFSKIILPLNDLKNSIDNSNLNFHVEVNYKEKKLYKGKNKIRTYFLFSISIFEDISPLSVNYSLINCGNSRSSFFSQRSFSNQTNEFELTKTNFANKTQPIFINFPFEEKIFKIIQLGNLILKKYFDFKIEEKNENIDLDDEEKFNKNKINNENSVMNLVNVNTKSIKTKKQIKQINFCAKYYSVIIEIIFFISFFIIYFQKIDLIKTIDSYFNSYDNLLMLGQTIHQIVLKVVLIQFQSNNIQTSVINNTFDNSFEFHIEQLNSRISDYLSFKEDFIRFALPKYKTVGKDMIFMNKYNYSLVDLNGYKNFVISDNVFSNLNVILQIITNHSGIVLIYNNSEYYFDDEIVNKSNYNNIQYYTVANCYLKILGVFYFNLVFQIDQLNGVFEKSIISKLSEHFFFTTLTYIICVCFIIFYIFEFYIFVHKSKNIFSKYFICHLQLRFFNKYLSKKTLLVISFFENYSEGDSLLIFDNLIIKDDNEDEEIFKIILTEQVENINMIKIRPFISNFKFDKNNMLNLVDINVLENEEKQKKELVCFSSNIKRIIESNKQSMGFEQTNQFKKRHAISRINFNKTFLLEKINSTEKKKYEMLNSTPISNKTKTNILLNQNNPSLNLNLLVNSNSIGSNKKLINKPVLTNQTEQSNNSTLSKSNVPLNETSNRTNGSQKSTLKILNKPELIKIKSPKRRRKEENKNKEKNEEYKKENNIKQNGYKLLKKPNIYLNFFLCLIPITAIFLTVTSVQIFYSKIIKNALEDIINIKKYIFEELNYISELVILYDLSILYNEEIIIEYTWEKNIFECNGLKDLLNNNNEIHIYKLLITCYQKIKSNVDKITYLGTKMKNLKHFQNILYSDDFCKLYSSFIYENRNNPNIPSLLYLQTINNSYLYYECMNIGGNLNSKGFKIAKETIFQLMVDNYNDFINDLNRTEISNYERLNNEYILIFQIEIARIIRKISLGYIINFNIDFKNIQDIIVIKELILMVCIVISSFFIGFSYIIYVKSICESISYIDFFNDCVLNTILFQ